LEKDGTVIMGAVNAPILDEFFFAEKGQGATLNDKPIQVSTCDQLINGMMGTGFACVRNNHTRNNLPYFSAILPHIRGIRRYGSVAIDLCYLACGRLDGFWELALHIYDIAAGALILQEAGGTLTDFNGRPDNIPNELVGTNGLLHAPLLAMLQEVDREQGRG
jgi:myo-inositol-1(or 4)-monophosphatase